jgi:hypothetical protein
MAEDRPIRIDVWNNMNGCFLNENLEQDVISVSIYSYDQELSRGARGEWASTHVQIPVRAVKNPYCFLQSKHVESLLPTIRPLSESNYMEFDS